MCVCASVRGRERERETESEAEGGMREIERQTNEWTVRQIDIQIDGDTERKTSTQKADTQRDSQYSNCLIGNGR